MNTAVVEQESSLGKGSCAPIVGGLALAATSFLEADKGAQPNWAHALVTDCRAEERTLMRTAFYQVVGWGVAPIDAERALGGFGRYVDDVVDGRGTIRLCLGLIVDTVCAGAASGWVPERTSHLLVEIQKQLDTGASSLDDIAAVVRRIRPGASVDEVLHERRPRGPGR